MIRLTKRRIGLAIADKLEESYVKYEGNPVYNPSPKNCEDPYVWREDGKYKIPMADKTGFGAPRRNLFRIVRWN